MKFGETKQKIVALVTTTLKALLSVAKTNGRLSGCEFYAGNIHYLFRNIIVHVYLHATYKKSAPRKERTEKMLPLSIVVTRIAPQ